MNKYLLRYGFEKDKTYRYTILTTGSFRINGPAGEMNTPIDIEMVVSQKILDFSEEKANVQVCIEKAEARCDIPKEHMPEVGKNFIMETDHFGNCKWLEGQAGWQGAEHSLIRFPKEEIEIGDIWVQKADEAAGSAVPYYNKYRLNGRDRRNKDLVILSSEIYTGHPDLRESKKLGTGSFTFNTTDNWIQDSDVRIKYDYFIPVPQQPGLLLQARTILNVDMERVL